MIQKGQGMSQSWNPLLSADRNGGRREKRAGKGGVHKKGEGKAKHGRSFLGTKEGLTYNLWGLRREKLASNWKRGARQGDWEKAWNNWRPEELLGKNLV